MLPRADLAEPRAAALFQFAFFLFAYYAYVGAFTPYAGLWFAARGMGPGEVGILMSLMQVTRIFGPGLWAWVADHTAWRVTVLRVTALSTLVIFGGLLLGRDFAAFFAVMLALNACTGSQAPLSDALILAELKGDFKRYGRLRLWGSVGFIIAVSVGGRLLDLWGILAMPWICWALLALVFIASFCLREKPHAPTHEEQPSIRSQLRKPEVISFFASTFLMVAAHAALYVFFTLYLAQLGYSKTTIGMMWSLGVIVEIAFFYFQAPLFRRFGVRNIMLIALFLAFLRFMLVGLGAQYLLLLIVAQVLHAASFAAHHSASVITLQRWFTGSLQSRGQGLYVSISYGLGGSFGGFLLSAFWDEADGRSVFVVAALLALAGMFAARHSYRLQNS